MNSPCHDSRFLMFLFACAFFGLSAFANNQNGYGLLSGEEDETSDFFSHFRERLELLDEEPDPTPSEISQNLRSILDPITELMERQYGGANSIRIAAGYLEDLFAIIDKTDQDNLEKRDALFQLSNVVSLRASSCSRGKPKLVKDVNGLIESYLQDSESPHKKSIAKIIAKSANSKTQCQSEQLNVDVSFLVGMGAGVVHRSCQTPLGRSRIYIGPTFGLSLGLGGLFTLAFPGMREEYDTFRLGRLGFARDTFYSEAPFFGLRESLDGSSNNGFAVGFGCAAHLGLRYMKSHAGKPDYLFIINLFPEQLAKAYSLLESSEERN